MFKLGIVISMNHIISTLDSFDSLLQSLKFIDQLIEGIERDHVSVIIYGS